MVQSRSIGETGFITIKFGYGQSCVCSRAVGRQWGGGGRSTLLFGVNITFSLVPWVDDPPTAPNIFSNPTIETTPIFKSLPSMSPYPLPPPKRRDGMGG